MSSLYKENSQPIYPMFEQPKGWLVNSLPKLREYSSLEDDAARKNCADHLDQAQLRRWENDFGVSADECKATVIIPVHDESHCLPSALGALMLSDIPSTAHIHFVFVVNGCTDEGKSASIVRNFLHTIGEVQTLALRLPHNDLPFNSEVLSVCKGNLQFLCVESSLASKVHALNLGNAIASCIGDIITVNIDANNWVEPDAIRLLLAQAHKEFTEGKNVVIGTHSMIDYRPSVLAELLKKAQQKVGKVNKESTDALHGWLMAWSTVWFQEMGGLKQVACDDYALSLESRKVGKEISFNKDAKVWGYFPNNFRDKLRAYTRQVRNAMQLQAAYRDDKVIQDLIEHDEPVMRNWQGRVQELLEKSLANPRKTPLFLVGFFLWEYARFQGSLEFARDPQTQTWEDLSSTK